MKILHLPLRPKPAELLQSTGMALEYFPAFEHKGIDDVPMHTHDFVEMNYIIKGHCQHVTKVHIYEDKTGSMGIIHYNQEHMILTPYGPVEKMNIYMDFRRFTLPAMPLDLQEIMGTILPMHPALQHKLNNIVHLQFGRPKLVTDILRSLYDELQKREAGYQEAVDHYFRLFLIECCRTAMNQGIQRGEPQDKSGFEQIEKVRHYIDRNFTKSLTLEQLAKRAGGTNPNYLCRRFKEYTGQTIVDYINRRRIEMALVLLRSGSDKILQICLKTGFNDISYFNRRFKKIVSMTPSEYRNQSGKV
jgi:AraC-like DNA-binding protein